MLNRYVAAGMVEEAMQGRHIMVVGINGRDVRASFDECRSRLDADEVSRVSSANGAERIELMSGGRIVFRSYQGRGHRGVSVDTVYLDTGVDRELTDPSVWDSFHACVASSPSAEIIRA
ncbi:hypothetical protein E0W80_04430 [Microbacterium sp. PI-1]|uniref:hypothetical protein n=1 Tax=Microbacterium sp. PI-1 TaxID=2545631 RepID=UPI0010395DEC|nr:hypothetical protein [Microbacterium sp. PI-1]TCJ28752.1 hypothetical protein E0W80_04430 [Microbacterium sp. PI-1]